MTQKESRNAISDATDKDLWGAVVELSKAHLRSYPDDGRVWLELARALYTFSRYEEAEHAFEQALAHCPQRFHGVVFGLRGNMEQRRGNYGEAEKFYLRAIEAAPKANYLRIYLGVLTFRRGDLKLAEQHYREAIATEGDEVDEAYANLGNVLVAQERYEEAVECYERAIEIDPNYKFAKLRLRDVRKILKLRQKNA